jgi:hypothetical protein
MTAAPSVKESEDKGRRPTIRPGDRVRVVLEGEVNESQRPGEFRIGGAGLTANIIFPSAAHVVSVEKLPDPPRDPDWWPPQPGDIVLPTKGTSVAWDPFKRLFRHTDTGTEATGEGGCCDLANIKAGTLLVRNSKAVQ